MDSVGLRRGAQALPTAPPPDSRACVISAVPCIDECVAMAAVCPARCRCGSAVARRIASHRIAPLRQRGDVPLRSPIDAAAVDHEAAVRRITHPLSAIVKSHRLLRTVISSASTCECVSCSGLSMEMN